MKTRIISGVLMALIVVFVLLAGFTLSPLVITAFVAIIAAVDITAVVILIAVAGIKIYVRLLP